MLERFLSLLPARFQVVGLAVAGIALVAIWFFQEEVESFRTGLRRQAVPTMEVAMTFIYGAIIPVLVGSLLLVFMFITASFIYQNFSTAGRRRKANVQLAREWLRFIDTEFNRDPSEPAEIESWLNRFVDWRDSKIVPLVTIANSEDRALTLSRLVEVEMKQWRADRTPRFNHVKSMMNQTLGMLRKLIDEFKP